MDIGRLREILLHMGLDLELAGRTLEYGAVRECKQHLDALACGMHHLEMAIEEKPADGAPLAVPAWDYSRGGDLA